jgi:hypothetical protein
MSLKITLRTDLGLTLLADDWLYRLVDELLAGGVGTEDQVLVRVNLECISEPFISCELCLIQNLLNYGLRALRITAVVKAFNSH